LRYLSIFNTLLIMSEETNETLDNNEEMEITEIETSGVIETHHSHAHVEMSSKEFEEKLTTFFTQHKKTKLNLIPRIVRELKGNEGEVLEHLHNKYVLGLSPSKTKKKGGKKKIAAGGHGAAGHGETHGTEALDAPPKPKSKKKLIIIIILVVVLGGGGAAAYLFKDKLFGGHGAEHGAPAGHGEAKAEGGHEGHDAAAAPQEETATPVTDSAAAAGTTDSAKTETPAAEHAAGSEGH
jgi:hypothetical protein